MTLEILTPKWALPLLHPKRYKGAKGGRGSGKSHFFAEDLIEKHIINPNFNSVCIREIQKSLKFSAKKLLEDKINEMGVSSYFDIQTSEIKCKNGKGIIIFQGMQDHTADSIKSLEGFDVAWVEEAQSISRRSLELLLPTIRKKGSEIWFSWNPDQPDDPVEEHFKDIGEDGIVVHVNYLENPFLPDTLKDEAERHKRVRPDTFDHVWLGGFNTKKDAQVFKDKFELKEFEVNRLFGEPLHGLDFGFARDPLAGVQLYIKDNCLYIRREANKVGLEIDDTVTFLKERIPQIEKYTTRADNARPELISFLNRKGLNVDAVEKGKGSVEDGVEFIKNFDRIYIHPECEETHREFRLYCYQVDKRTGDILPKLEDSFNHHIDAIRYALEPMIKSDYVDYGSLL